MKIQRGTIIIITHSGFLQFGLRRTIPGSGRTSRQWCSHEKMKHTDQRPHPHIWTWSITALSFGCESFVLLFYTTQQAICIYILRKAGSLHCSTRFSIPQVQSFHCEGAQSLMYCCSELQLQIKVTLRLGGVSLSPPSPSLDEGSALLSRKRGLQCFVFPWVMSNSISVQYKSFGRAKDLQPQLPKRTSSLPREAVLIPRDSTFSHSTRTPWSNSILWPVIYGRGGSRDRVDLQVWVSNCYSATLKELMLYKAGRYQRTVEFPLPHLLKEGLKRERTTVNTVANSPNRHQLLRWTRLLTGQSESGNWFKVY